MPKNPNSIEDFIRQNVTAEWDGKDVKHPISKSKDEYISNAHVGVIIAFKINEEKALSGKVEEIHENKFVVRTKNGIRFSVLKDNIIWVKTGNRWPKGVYMLLKGGNENSGNNNGKT